MTIDTWRVPVQKIRTRAVERQYAEVGDEIMAFVVHVARVVALLLIAFLMHDVVQHLFQVIQWHDLENGWTVRHDAINELADNAIGFVILLAPFVLMRLPKKHFTTVTEEVPPEPEPEPATAPTSTTTSSTSP